MLDYRFEFGLLDLYIELRSRSIAWGRSISDLMEYLVEPLSNSAIAGEHAAVYIFSVLFLVPSWW